MMKNKDKVMHLITRRWKQKEWNHLSKAKQLHIRILTILYLKTWKRLFSVEFWKDLNSEHYSCIGEWFFFFKYKLGWIVIVEKNGTEYCV